MHTFLLETGTWVGKGQYIDKDSNAYDCEGITSISHKENIWVMDGKMKIAGLGAAFKNTYEVIPFGGHDYTAWVSHNPALGTLGGKFMIVDDCLLSAYQSEDGCYSGYEVMIKCSDSEYKSRGYVFAGNEKLSSWTVALKRDESCSCSKHNL